MSDFFPLVIFVCLCGKLEVEVSDLPVMQYIDIHSHIHDISIKKSKTSLM